MGSTPFSPVAIDVLDDHNRVVHEHAEDEDEAEQDDHVHAVSHRLNADERDQHRERDRHRDEDRVAEPEKRHQHRNDEEETRDDVVLELVHHHPNLGRLVAEYGDDGAGRKCGFLTRELGLDLVGDLDQVRAGAFLDGHRHRWAPVDARDGRVLDEPVLDFGDVTDVDRLAVAHLDHEVFDLLRIVHFRREPHEILQPPDVDLAAGDVQVLAPDREHEVGQAELVERQPAGVDVHLDLADLAADDLHAVDPGDRFEVVTEVLGYVREPHQSHVACEAHDEDRDLRHVDVLHRRVFRFRRQVGLREVDLLPHFLECGVEIDFRVELDLDVRIALGARRADLLQPGDALQLGLDRPGDEGLHVLGSDAGIDSGNEDQRDLHFGKRLPRHGHVSARAGDNDEGDENVDGEPVIDAVVRDLQSSSLSAAQSASPTERTGWPSTKLRCPVTIKLSPSFSPSSTTMRPRSLGPVSTFLSAALPSSYTNAT